MNEDTNEAKPTMTAEAQKAVSKAASAKPAENVRRETGPSGPRTARPNGTTVKVSDKIKVRHN